jgi:phasin family protein
VKYEHQSPAVLQARNSGARKSDLQGDSASCGGRLTPEKSLNFGTAPGQPRLNFESQERCSVTKERGREEMANRRRERTTQAAQENRRGPDTIGQAAQAVAALGEQAARASGNAARMAAGASEHAARAGANLFESTAGAVEQLWHSGLDIASHFAEQSSSQLARSMGLSDEKAQEAAERSSGNIDAIVQSSRAYADAFQGISRELSSLCRERMDRNLEKINDMMRSRSPQELIAAQSDLFRDNLEGFLQSSRRVAEASVRVADQATRHLTKSIEKQRRAA